MHSLSQTFLLATAAVLSLSSAAPLEGQEGHSFTVHQVRNPKHVRNGAFALAKAYRKYNAAMPDYLSSALSTTYAHTKRATSGSAVTTPEEYDTEYLTPVSIGTPAQKLNLDFDTGSADLWVFSTELTSKLQSGHGVYSASKSSTAKKLSSATWSIQYGDGSGASGDVYTDVVNIGGVSFKTQAVEAANNISTQFTQDTDNDGLVGLAFSSINTVSPTAQKTFFDNVKSSLAAPLFAADLKHDARKLAPLIQQDNLILTHISQLARTTLAQPSAPSITAPSPTQLSAPRRGSGTSPRAATRSVLHRTPPRSPALPTRAPRCCCFPTPS